MVLALLTVPHRKNFFGISRVHQSASAYRGKGRRFSSATSARPVYLTVYDAGIRCPCAVMFQCCRKALLLYQFLFVFPSIFVFHFFFLSRTRRVPKVVIPTAVIFVVCGWFRHYYSYCCFFSSVPSCVLKLFEHLILCRLGWFAETKHLLSPE